MRATPNQALALTASSLPSIQQRARTAGRGGPRSGWQGGADVSNEWQDVVSGGDDDDDGDEDNDSGGSPPATIAWRSSSPHSSSPTPLAPAPPSPTPPTPPWATSTLSDVHSRVSSGPASPRDPALRHGDPFDELRPHLPPRPTARCHSPRHAPGSLCTSLLANRCRRTAVKLSFRRILTFPCTAATFLLLPPVLDDAPTGRKCAPE